MPRVLVVAKEGSCQIINPFRAVEELMGSVESRELGVREPRLPRFILLGTFSYTLLVVLILVYDCHL